VMGEIQGRKMHCRIFNIKSPRVQEDPKIVRGWDSIWGSITTTVLCFYYSPLAENGQGDILVQDKLPFLCPYFQTVSFFMYQ